MSAFQPVLGFSLRAEGGFVNDPKDPGGATNWGGSYLGIPAASKQAVRCGEKIRKETIILACGLERYPKPNDTLSKSF